MNLHSIAGPIVGAVNPLLTVGLQASVGNVSNPDFTRSPAYATPGRVTASIGAAMMASASGTTLTVSSIDGSLWPGDEVSGTDGVNALPPFCEIVEQTGGTPNGIGAYEISGAAVLNSCPVTAASTVLNVTASGAGVLQVGQTLADQGALLAGTTIASLGDGAGAVGTYNVNQAQTVPPETMTTFASIIAQVQPLSSRDLRQVEGLNLQGTVKALYVNGPLLGVVRPAVKGGDMITLPNGSVWLVTLPLEQWNDTAGWSKAVIVLQNDALIPSIPQSDAQPMGAP